MNINAKANKEDSSQITKENENVKIAAPFAAGVSYELCAGIIDEKLSLEETARKEILEETGYDVPISKIERLFTHRGVGAVGSCANVFYAEVSDDMKTAEGGGLQDLGEFIELFYLPLCEAKDFVFKDEYSKPSGAIAALMWFFLNKEGK